MLTVTFVIEALEASHVAKAPQRPQFLPYIEPSIYTLVIYVVSSVIIDYKNAKP